jgi:hypothetical protein
VLEFGAPRLPKTAAVGFWVALTWALLTLIWPFGYWGLFNRRSAAATIFGYAHAALAIVLALRWFFVSRHVRDPVDGDV